MPKRLVAGPFVGEFGWELMQWQGLVRRMAHGYDEVHVAAPKGHEALYQDIANFHYIPLEPYGTPDCWRIESDLGYSIQPTLSLLRKMRGDLISPAGRMAISQQRFIRYGTKRAEADVVLHARGPIGKRPQHAWPQEDWDVLVNHLHDEGIHRIVAIGTQAYCPAGARDFRHAPLQEVMDLLAGASICIGPSSGPMHLASLCGTPHVVWTDDQIYGAIGTTNRVRYETLWNPLKTPVTVLDQHGWHPPAKVVLAATLKGLEKWTRSPQPTAS